MQTIEKTIQVERTELLMSVFGAFDENIKLIERELGVRAALIATGAHAARVIPHCERAFELDGHAALRGLALIWERNRRQRRQ